MITAQDIREKTFSRARINGYDMPEVDDFLEELAEEIAAAQKENAVLKSKMKVLVDKIEEYRSNEEALNKAVLSAQKLAVQIENDARTRSTAMLADADAQVKLRLGTIPEQIADQQKKLSDAQNATAAFFAQMRELCNIQLKSLNSIEQGIAPKASAPAKTAAPAKAAPSVDLDETVRAIDKNMARIKPEPSFNLDLSEDIVSNRSANYRPANNPDSTQSFTL